MVGNCEGCTTFGTTTSQNLASVFCSHSFAESMFVDSAAVGGLKSSFHCMICLILFFENGIIRIRSAKLTNDFHIAKFSVSKIPLKCADAHILIAISV